MQQKVKNFSDFFRINEAEEGPTAIFPSIFFIYFDLYMNAVPYIGGYKDTIKDIKSEQQANLEEKPTAFESIINKVVDQIGNEEIKGELKSAAITDSLKSLKEAFDSILGKSSDEEKKEAQDKLSDICFDQIDNLVNAVKSIKESYFFNEEFDSFIFEKNTFKDERSSFLSKIVANISAITSIINNPPTDRIKGKLQPFLDKLTNLKKELEDDAKWEGMKRRERKERLEQIPMEIQDLINGVSDANQKELESAGVEKKVLGLINTASTSIKETLTKVSEIEKVRIEEETAKAEKEKTEKGEAISTDKLDTKGLVEITTGKKKVQNLQKKGPNREQIKKVQEAMVKLLPKDVMSKVLPEIKDFKVDGLYGGNTEKMIAQISKVLGMLNPDLKSDGGTMSPLFQAAVIKLAEGDMQKLQDSVKSKIAEYAKKAGPKKEEAKGEEKDAESAEGGSKEGE